MTPFYDKDGITLFCGDNREVLPTLGRFDLLLTDPPYGIDRGHHDGTICKNPRHNWKKHERLSNWDSNPVCRELLKQCFATTNNQIVWGGNYFVDALKPSMGWIAWDKGQDFTTSDFELAFTSFNKAARRIVVNRGAIAREGALHPTQKPMDVIRFCIGYAGKESETILDPFAGSGTTLLAAKLEGRQCTGIEISEDYCRIAVQRLRQRVLEFSVDSGED